MRTTRQTIEKLETDLSSFLIAEIPRGRLEQEVINRQIYLYKGLNIYLTSRARATEKAVSIRIGAFEAEFNLESVKRLSGSLIPDDEHNVRVWLSQPKIKKVFRNLFTRADEKATVIAPFDLETFYEK